ncbi:hypothetical protein BpHYR1_052951 [Brachionus plicatilis]|uniref:Uncharacterized protein n=1 Tax=Brachionus plicatilis TaxID=10195 RepID=A0A3M7S3G0_BRAPC|nr:hypothetical protein BpHYR1_052951 [Brachionus plicatilis]
MLTLIRSDNYSIIDGTYEILSGIQKIMSSIFLDEMHMKEVNIIELEKIPLKNSSGIRKSSKRRKFRFLVIIINCFNKSEENY